MRICLYGSGSAEIDKIYTNAEYKLGCLIAQKSHTLVYGGGDNGIMGACAQGVLENNGKLIGIAPEWIKDYDKLCKNCSEFIYVESMDKKKNKFLEESDVFIIAPGGIGTLDEFFETIVLRKLERHNKEIIIFNIDGFYNKMFDMFDDMVQKRFLFNHDNLVKIANTVDEIFEYLESS